MYNAETQEEKKISTQQGQLVSPSIHGDYVVWHDLTHSYMYLYDIENNQELSIGMGRYPIVHDGKVLYKTSGNGGLSLYDIQNRETKVVMELPYHEYVYAFAFNGKTALWAKTNFDMVVTYSMADTSQSNVTVNDLTSPTKQTIQNSKMVIGDHYAAWLEHKNGTNQIITADIRNQQTNQMTHSTENQKLYSFNGDQLIVKGDNGNLVYRTIIPVANNNPPIPDVTENEQTN